MNTEQERRDFEKLFHRFDLRPSIRVGHYSDLRVEFMWEAWQARAALQSQDREDAFCVWHNDPETDNAWDTSCRQLFVINDGTPSENGMSFCCYCSKPIDEATDHARHIEGSKDD